MHYFRRLFAFLLVLPFPTQVTKLTLGLFYAHHPPAISTMPSSGTVFSYTVDWAILIGLAVAGFIAGKFPPNKRPFSLHNPDISLPYKCHDTVSLGAAAAVSLVVPAILMLCFALASLVALKASDKKSPQRHPRRHEMWKFHAGLLGLLLSAVLAFVLTNGTKNLLGKPRPNLLGRCQPDVANVANFVVSNATDAGGQLVTAAICTNTDKSVVDEGFRSFPSGHSSAVASGLVYLSLWLAARLGVGSPFLMGGTAGEVDKSERGTQTYDLDQPYGDSVHGGSDDVENGLANSKGGQDAAAPLYLLAISLMPLGAAIYICATRWYDFQHHGLDIMSGFIIGAVSSILGFRYYYQPVRVGAGFSWEPRAARRRKSMPSCCSGGEVDPFCLSGVDCIC